ncbi:alpha/beta fold hydrolase [candidate division KSB1 bacterium]|nr:alpha/beta fold hydrolase [candidate division KSB1 bacterium]
MHGEWLHKPENNTAVVFVHGILSSGETCWQNKNGAFWPALLQREPDLNGLGIYVYSYRTDIFSGNYQLGNVVDDLKERMRLDEVLQNQRLIFVCHSMGGIVVRQYLVTRALDLIEANIDIGLFLVASPALGSEYANWLSLFANIFGNSQAEALRFAQDNAWLNDLDKNFMNLKAAGKLQLSGKELIEDNFIILKKFFRKQVVEPFSGARYFGEPYKVPHSDHFSIAKPENKQAIQHRLFVQFSKEMLQAEVSAKAARPAYEPSSSPHSLNLSAQGDLSARDVVGGNKTVDQSISVGDLQHASGVAIGEKASVTIIHQAALPAFKPLHQLPTPPADFTGREAELNELMAKMETGGVTISGLQGMGGIGKTVLALKLAEQLTPRYPDAQFFLDLKGASDKPLPPGAAMAHVIRAYHPTAKLPESETALKPLYQSVLHGQRALLFMDNARDVKQIEPLLPPATCLLLVTSRQHFTLPGLYAKDLNTLPPKEAGQLLLTIAPRIDAAAEAMAKLCGYLPHALRLAASALAEQIDLSPADYLARLENAQTRLDLVEASLSLSYDLLDAETQKWWRLLSVFPDTFDQAAGAAVWEMEVEPAQKTLSVLVKYSLVEWQPATRRYRLHDLARLFAAKWCTEAERAAGQQRHAEHYATALRSANKLYEQGGEAIQRGLALFDLEWGNIQAGQAWAKQNADKNKQALELCNRYPDWGYMIFALRQHNRERIDWLGVALKAARKLGRKRSEGGHLGNLGHAHVGLGELRRAIEFYEQALVIDREIGNRGGEGVTLGNLGEAYAGLGEPRRAIEFIEQALMIDREIGDRRGEGDDLGNLGDAYLNLGEPRRAIEFYEQYLKIAREIGDRRGEGAALNSFGDAYLNLGEPRRAIEFYEQALVIFREIGDRRNEGINLGNLGNAYLNLGEPRRAIEFYEQQLKIAREIGNRRGEGNALGNLGLAYADLGEPGRAIEFYEQALEIARETGARRGEGNALWNMSLAQDKLDERKQAIANAKAALKIFEQIEDPNAAKVRRQLDKWRGQKSGKQ